jgi:hypothetical protein
MTVIPESLEFLESSFVIRSLLWPFPNTVFNLRHAFEAITY